MHHVMFDVDGTLVESLSFDEECYVDAVRKVLGHSIDLNSSTYIHVSDAGILDQVLRENSLFRKREELHALVKSAFVTNIKSHLSQNPAQQVPGASEFISYLRKQRNVSLSIATGGWGETARLKLESAGIDITGIPLASSNDHYSRTEIMKMALRKASVSPNHRLTYFGDADWDKKACEELQFNFVLVGNRVKHDQAITNLVDLEPACRFIGL